MPLRLAAEDSVLGRQMLGAQQQFGIDRTGHTD
jgi:hypothetical protein